MTSSRTKTLFILFRPITVGSKAKDIEELREHINYLNDNEDLFIEALSAGDSDQIFLLQLRYSRNFNIRYNTSKCNYAF